MKLEKNVKLAELTTIGLGGPAKHLARCENVADIKEALDFAKHNKLEVFVLGGGSNVVFPDKGFGGLVLKVELKGTRHLELGRLRRPGVLTESKDIVVKSSRSFDYTDAYIASAQDDASHAELIKVAAGEDWDEFVRQGVEKGLAGVECLSGIPGTVGGTPIQNVGAYGQEVSETIFSVRALALATGEEIEFSNKDCDFSYRSSRFKKKDFGKYIILAVVFKLRKNGEPALRYPELKALVEKKALDGAGRGSKHLKPPPSLPLEGGGEKKSPPVRRGGGVGGEGEKARDNLMLVREAVLELRKKKSMVLDPNDPNTKSCGSFFTNPIISNKLYKELENSWRACGNEAAVPYFPLPEGVKIPAGWLVERSGFGKGYEFGRVGLSTNHALALVNRGGTTAELLNFAQMIQQGVEDNFGLKIIPEPFIVK